MNPVVARVADYFGIPEAELLGPSRVRSVTYARHIAAYLLVESGVTLQKAAEAVGCVNHTTAFYAHRKIEAERRWKGVWPYDRVRADLEALEGEA